MEHWERPFFRLLKMAQCGKTWHFDEQGRCTYTMLKLRNPIMDGIRRFGLHPPREKTQPDDQGMVDLTSFTDTQSALSGNQTVDAQGYRDEITENDPGYVGDNVSISRKRCGATGVQKVWTRTVTLRGTCVTCWRALFGHQYAPSWCLTMFSACARAGQWNVAGLYGPFAKLYLFPFEERCEEWHLAPF